MSPPFLLCWPYSIFVNKVITTFPLFEASISPTFSLYNLDLRILYDEIFNETFAKFFYQCFFYFFIHIVIIVHAYTDDDNNCATIRSIERYSQRSLPRSSFSLSISGWTTLRMSYQPAQLNYETSVIRRVRRGDVQGEEGKGYRINRYLTQTGYK